MVKHHRPSDTAALVAAGPREGHYSRHVEKCEGGHIIRETSYGPDDNYSKTFFKPRQGNGVGNSSMAEAVREVKR